MSQCFRPPFASLALALACLSLTACVGWKTSPAAASQQALPIPSQWQQLPQTNGSANALIRQAEDVLAYFSDAQMQQAFVALEANNFELKRQALRVKQAASQAGIETSALWPSLDLNLSQQAQALESQASQDSAELSLSVSWEIDIWQKLSRQQAAAELDLEAELQDYQALRFSLAAQLSQAWFQQQAAYLQWLLASDYQNKLTLLLQLVESRYQRGISSLLELKQAQSNLAAAKADALNRHALYLDQHLALAQLLYLHEQTPLKALPTSLDEHYVDTVLTAFASGLADTIPLDLPAQLIQRRPDLQALAHRLDAQLARFDSRQKNRLPSLSLTANLALQEESLGALISDGSLFKRLRANLLLPLFDAGRLRQQSELAYISYQQASLNYAQAVSDAILEVEQTLRKNALFEQRLASQQQALILARDTSRLALRDYQQGLIDLAQLIQEQGNYINTRSRFLDLKLSLLQTRSQLLLALGGDFDIDKTAAELAAKEINQ